MGSQCRHVLMLGLHLSLAVMRSLRLSWLSSAGRGWAVVPVAIRLGSESPRSGVLSGMWSQCGVARRVVKRLSGYFPQSAGRGLS